jgi:hypothetical protein
MLTIRRDQLHALGQRMRERFIDAQTRRLAATEAAPPAREAVAARVARGLSLGFRTAPDLEAWLDVDLAIDRLDERAATTRDEARALLGDGSRPAHERLFAARRLLRRPPR